MATYYVRTDGSNSNSGTGSGTGSAWATIGKALGATGIASGDTVWIAPGTYREQITVGMTSATAETFIKGDPTASQFSGVSPGEVVLTAFTTNDDTKPTSPALTLSGRDYLSFSDIVIIASSGGLGSCVDAFTQSSHHIKFTRCGFQALASQGVWFQSTFGTPFDVIIDRCIFRTRSEGIIFWATKGTGSNYNLNIDIKSSIFINHGASSGIDISSQGTGSNIGVGGVTITNCYSEAWQGLQVNMGTATLSATVKNCVFSCGNFALSAGTSGEITEDYNRFVGCGTNRTNVTAGTNSKDGATGMDFGENWMLGIKNVIAWYPRANGPNIAKGTATGAPTTDLYGNSFAGTPSVGPVETGTISTTSGGLIVHPGMTGGIRG